jgi:hypothetical protein
MGQYWKPVNLDRKEYILPHKLGAGLKLWEQLANAPGVGAALIVLTAAMPEQRGGGDLSLDGRGDMPEDYAAIAARTIGRWAGDRVAIVGDYAAREDLAPEHEAETVYERCSDEGDYTDITDDVCAVIAHELQGEFVGDGWRDWKPAG